MTMEVNGYQLRNALKKWDLRKEAAQRRFRETLYKFEGETSESPDEAMQASDKAETAICGLQTAQMRYNLAVTFSFGGSIITLAEAIKREGPLSRMEKLWRQAAGIQPNRHSHYDDPNFSAPSARIIEEGKKVETPIAQLTSQQLIERVEAVNNRLGELKALIAEANAKKVMIELNPGFLD